MSIIMTAQYTVLVVAIAAQATGGNIVAPRSRSIVVSITSRSIDRPANEA